MEQNKIIMNLAVASLISEAEFDIFSKDLLLKMPISRKKFSYLEDIITESDLAAFVELSSYKEQMTILSHSCLPLLKEQWYDDKKKIFSRIIDPKRLTLESIIMSITLFGNRKLETISIPTTIDKDYVKGLAYCMEHYIKVPVIPGSNQIKITNIPQVVLSNIKDISAIHSAELMNILTKKEKKRLIGEGERI